MCGPTTCLFCLSNDLLSYIFSFLETSHVIKNGLISKRFYRLDKQINRSDCLHIDCSDWTPVQLQTRIPILNNRFRQLSIVLNQYVHKFDMSCLTDIYSVKLNHYKFLTNSDLVHLTKVQHLELSGAYRINDLSPFENNSIIRSISLSDCPKIVDLSPLNMIPSIILSGTSINIFENRSNSTKIDISLLTNVRNLELTNFILISPFPALNKLTSLSMTKCSGISNLSHLNLEHLSLTHCHDIKQIPYQNLKSLKVISCRGISDHKRFVHISDLTISHPNWKDFIGLRNQKFDGYKPRLRVKNGHNLTNPYQNIVELTLVICHELTDPSIFANVDSVELIQCHGLTNVSSLRRIRKLNLSRCEGVTDVSALGNVYHLNLSGCPVSDVSALRSVHTLIMKGCTELVDASALIHVHDLDLAECSNLINLPSMEWINQPDRPRKTFSLNLKSCIMVTDISGVGSVYNLNLSNCTGPMIIPPNNQIHKLDLSLFDYTGQIDCANLSNIRDLDLSSGQDIINLDQLHNVIRLNLSDCSNITHLPPLKHLKELILVNNHNLIDIGYLPSLHSLTLINCSLIRTLPRCSNGSNNDIPDLSSLFYLNLFPLDQFTPPNMVEQPGETPSNKLNRIVQFYRSQVHLFHSDRHRHNTTTNFIIY